MPPKPIETPEKGKAAIWFWIAQSPVAGTVGKRRVRKKAVKASSG